MSTVALMVGIAASGKSTYAQALFDASKTSVALISTDQIRSEIGTGEDDQSVSREAFEWAQLKLEDALEKGMDLVIIDAMNLTHKSRKKFINIARRYGATVDAYCMMTSIKECIWRNERRARHVPGPIIINQAHRIKYPENGEVDHVFYIVSNQTE